MPQAGGAERMAHTLAQGLTARGHQLTVLAQRGPSSAADRDFDQTAPYRVVRYRRPPAQHRWPQVVARPLIRLARNTPLDVVLAFYAYPTGYAAVHAKLRTRLPVVITPRGGDLYPQFHALKKPRVAHAIAQGYRRADRLVVISNWLAQRIETVTDLTRDQLPPMDMVPNGIDLQAFDTRLHAARNHLPPPSTSSNRPLLQPPFVLHLARLHAVKQHSLALDALAANAALFRQHRTAYVIAGAGPERATLETQSQRQNLTDLVHFTGHVEEPFKSWLLAHARFAVTTSREEGMPNAVLEAMAAGLPTLASNIGPHQELLAEHPWGKLVNADHPQDLQKALAFMLQTDTTPMTRVALQLRDRYSLNAMLDGYETALAAVLR